MTLSSAVIKGDVRAAARLMRMADDRLDGYMDEMAVIWEYTGNAHIVGITGVPGSGKSSLTDALITHYRNEGLRVGVAAVDPSSPFSGGAILGDRVRMGRHSTDEGVFIRSIASRGRLGGLSVSTTDIVAILDAFGSDIIFVETVGVGQDEVDIASVSDTCVVVVIPGMGDDIQAIKAGILEIADIFVLNKSDRDEASQTAAELVRMQELGGPVKPVVKTVATNAYGIPELVKEISNHKNNIEDLNERRSRRLYHTAVSLFKEFVFTDRYTYGQFQEDFKIYGTPYGVAIAWLNQVATFLPK